ncbi:MAG: hypothetical protein K2K21_04215, partial [Lachnospiraceae bacterium]|nr:hypothetical protein [Lachnospiraceae bacterium]
EYYLDKMAMERTIEEYHLDKMAMERTIESQKAKLADKDVEIQRLRAEIEKLKNSGLQTNN